MTWHISTIENDEFFGEYSTREDAIKGGIAEGCTTFWVGESRPPLPLSEGVYGDAVIESALESLEDEWLIDGHEWKAKPEQLKTLQEELRLVMDRWMDQYKLHPTWFVMDKVELIDSSKEVG